MSVDWGVLEERLRRESQSFTFFATVIKRDAENALLWCKELEAEPIPLVGIQHEATFIVNGQRRTTKLKPVVPQIGDEVLIVRTRGGLLRCLGSVMSRGDWISERPLVL